MPAEEDEDIAIVGIGCRFPGADNIEEFWRVLEKGENHVKDIPPDRWDNEKFYSENPDEPGKIYVRKAGLLSDHDKWDNRLFGISDQEAVRIDPQQRYVLECTHMALEDGGFTRKHISGSKTGVFIGVMNDDYKGLTGTDHRDDTNFTATGLSTTVIASRLSYVYNLQGPCMTIDTACSSAMMALHLGCQAIRSGDCEMAICGGVSSILSPDMFIPLCKARMLSAIGQCQTFCDTADGYARGEGCGVVILKSLKKTSKGTNNIWGIIKTGINQDGRAASPMTAPSSEQQQQLLHAVYERYHVNPSDLQYIELHGTGTPVGDPTEVNAFASFMNSIDDFDSDSANAPFNKRILIGSVKTNIGHTESAAAMAGLIKVLLMMRNETIVKSLHINKNKSNLNSKIRLDDTVLDIATDVENWPVNHFGYRMACVNSFGFGGSNGHAIIKQIPESSCITTQIKSDNFPHFVCLSGRDKLALLGNINHFIKDAETVSSKLCDISHTSIFCRDKFERRTLLFGKTLEEVKLNAELKQKSFETVAFAQKLNIVMVFCGVGTTWTGMGVELMKTQHIFKQTVQKIDEYLLSYSDISIAEKLKESEDLSDPFLNHIAIFTVQIALFELWKSLGVLPDIIIGQSVGEVAAAYASGALTLPSAVKVIYHRSRILARQTGGNMMVVGNVRLSEIENACLKFPGSVNIAVYNSPVSCTLSGTQKAIEDIETDVKACNGSFFRHLKVKCAYHSHFMDNCLSEIASVLTDIEIGNGQRILHLSTVTGHETNPNKFASGDYWAHNIRQPVLFMQAVEKSAKSEATNVYIEIGPRQVLKLHLPNIITDNTKTVCLPSMNSGNSDCFYTSMATLYEMGVDVDMSKAMSCKGKLSSIPKYHFKKTATLFMPSLTQHYLSGLLKSIGDQGFVQHLSDEKFTVTLSKDTTPFVFDHTLFGSVTVPGATYVEAAVQGACNVLDAHHNDIEITCNFEKPCMIENERTTVLSLSFQGSRNESDQNLQYRVQQESRTLCSGSIIRRKPKEYHDIDIPLLKRRLTQTLTSEEIYSDMEKIGLQYGESLRVIQSCYSGRKSCLSVMKLPPSAIRFSMKYCLHPIVIDAMFQTSNLLVRDASEAAGGIPKGFKSLRVKTTIAEIMLIYTTLVRVTRLSSFYRVILCTQQGTTIAEVNDLEVRGTKTSLPNDNISYELHWKQVEFKEDIEHDRKYVGFPFIVFGSRRFLSWLSRSNHLLNACKLEIQDETNAFEEIAMTALSASKEGCKIIFAPCYSYDDIGKKSTRQIYEIVKNNLLSLQTMLKVKRSLLNESCPIFIITEKAQRLCQSYSENSNFIGAELWGFVRCAMTEMPSEDLRLVDVDLHETTVGTSLSLLLGAEKKFPETLIRNGSVYISAVCSSPTQDIVCIQTDLKEISESLILRSENTNCISEPFLTQCNTSLKQETKQIISENLVNILVSKLYVKNYEMFHKALHCEQADSPEIQVNACEFRGWVLNERNNASVVDESQSYGVCFPVPVSTVVTVPRCCTFTMEEMPFYIPGLVSEVVSLWRVSTQIKSKSNVLIVVCDKGHWKANILLDILLYRKSKGAIVSWLDLDAIEFQQYRYTHAIVVQLETASNISVLDKVTGIRKVISMDSWLPWSTTSFGLQKRLSTKINLLVSEEVYDGNVMVNTVPLVLKYMKSNNTFIKTVFEERMPLDTFKLSDLPYHSIDILTAPGHASLPVLQYPSMLFKKDAYYIFVGGTSGLGWELLQYCAELGAGNLITLSRRALSPDKKALMKNIEKAHGCTIRHVQGDVTDLESLKGVFNTLKQKNANVKGIFHGGGVLKDATLENMTKEDLEIALRPKVLGTLNLHEACKDFSLDFFMMHSSVAAVFGNPGQCNYGAGNSFQDSFAYFRQSRGYNAQSINWGALTMGMSTDSSIDLKNRFQRQGIHFLNEKDVRTSFNEMILTGCVQKIFGIFDWQKFYLNPNFGVTKKKIESMVDLKSLQTQKDHSQLKEIKGIPSNFLKQPVVRQKQIMKDIAVSAVKESLLLDTDEPESNVSLYQLGIDSMSAMSISNALFEVTHVRIPVMFLLSNATTVEALTNFLLRELNSGDEKRKDSNIMSADHEILNKSITFIQASILSGLEHENGANFVMTINYELSGKRIPVKAWRVILKDLLTVHSGLRQIFRWNASAAKYDVFEKNVTETNVPVTVVPFACIFDKSDLPKLDPRDDIPILFHLSCKGKMTRMKIFLHTIVTDMRSIEIIFRDLEICAKHHFFKSPLPSVNDVNITKELQRAVLPRLLEMKTFWKEKFKRSIKPISLSNSSVNAKDEIERFETKTAFTEAQFDSIYNFLGRENLTMSNFILSSYFLVVHEMTGMECIPLVTSVNIRGFVPALENVVTRCVNEVPVVGTVDRSQLVNTYLRENALKLNEIIENAAYPFQLIKEEMKSEELRQHIGRHRFVVDDITNLFKQTVTKSITVSVSSIQHRRHTYETCLFLYQDFARKSLCLDLLFNTDVLSIPKATSILERLKLIISVIVDANNETTVEELLLLKDSKQPENNCETNKINSDVPHKKLFEKRLGTIRSSLDINFKERTDIMNIVTQKRIPDEEKDIICGYVEMQSVHGYTRKVKLRLQRTESHEQEYILSWGKCSEKISLKDVTEIHIKKITGRFALFLQKGRKWILFMANDLANARMWFDELKTALEKCRPGIE